jgi:hypothetical protein
MSKIKKTRKSLLELSPQKAKNFFLQGESYFSIDIPPYFKFDNLLRDLDKIISKNKNIKSSTFNQAKKHYDVNYILLTNKDGKYAWRPIQLINPFLYVYLVNLITSKNNWYYLKNKFKKFSKNKNIKCNSLPVISLSKNTNKGEQIRHWLDEIEKESIKLALVYDYLIEVDIYNCYGMIYTHSIPWALYGKNKAKKNRREDILGNQIDSLIQAMQFGQTNGIPQGSVLMDFIAEIVLAAIDFEISKKTKNLDYKILRYRDDYRIFVKDLQTGEKILKILSEVLSGYGLTLNNDKTTISDQVVMASFKEAKFNWIVSKKKQKNLLKYLLIIYDHSNTYPNSGTLITYLFDFYKLVEKKNKVEDAEVLISILINIAYQNPKTYQVVSAIISYLFKFFKKNQIKKIIKEIRQKFNNVSNAGHLEIWLQRISLPYKINLKYKEKMCQLVTDKLNNNNKTKLWNCSWINQQNILKLINKYDIVDLNSLNKAIQIKTIKKEEIKIFSYNS